MLGRDLHDAQPSVAEHDDGFEAELLPEPEQGVNRISYFIDSGDRGDHATWRIRIFVRVSKNVEHLDGEGGLLVLRIVAFIPVRERPIEEVSVVGHVDSILGLPLEDGLVGSYQLGIVFPSGVVGSGCIFIE